MKLPHFVNIVNNYAMSNQYSNKIEMLNKTPATWLKKIHKIKLTEQTILLKYTLEKHNLPLKE